MKTDFTGRHFLKLLDFTPEEIEELIDLAADLKKKKKAGELVDVFKGKNIAVIFEKTSTRTRCSFEVAAHDLGMGVTYLDPTAAEGWRRKKSTYICTEMCIRVFFEKMY